MKPHYHRIRKVKTHSGSTAIQVGFYKGKNFQVLKHIGSAKEREKVDALVELAQEYIRVHSVQPELNFYPQSEEVLYKRGIRIVGSSLKEAQMFLSDVYRQIGFEELQNDILKYFSLLRVLEPASKVKSIELLAKYFNIHYKKTTVFRELEKLVKMKEEVIRIAIQYAKDHLKFDFSLVFYDVTTLYFETHTADDFRLNGFSKDNKINQPQILIGLLVNHDGFPIYYDCFKGNTFEGHTMIPIIMTIKQTYQIKSFTVVADAGMLSAANLEALEKENIDYIVGYRIGTLPVNTIERIAKKLHQTDKKIIREATILYEYSSKRAKKDKADTDKQVNKAEYLRQNPSKVMRRSKFLSTSDTHTFILNEELIKKHRLLEGIKAYKTNIKRVRKQLLIDRYKDLWKIEQSFRIAKSDLQARPIYHRKKRSIEYHILIVFIALCMTKVIEMKTQQSIQKVIDDLKDRWTVTLHDDISHNSLTLSLNKKPH